MATTASSSYLPIASDAQPIDVTAAAGGNHLFLFNGTAYTDKPAFLNFQLRVADTQLARTHLSFYNPDRSRPVTMIGVKELAAGGTYTVGVDWHTGYDAVGSLYSSGAFPHWLVAFTR